MVTKEKLSLFPLTGFRNQTLIYFYSYDVGRGIDLSFADRPEEKKKQTKQTEQVGDFYNCKSTSKSPTSHLFMVCM
jgi:hypothetical protein